MEPNIYTSYVSFAQARLRHLLEASRADCARAFVAETHRVLSERELETYLSALPREEREREVETWRRGFRDWLAAVTTEDVELLREVRDRGLSDDLRIHAEALTRRYAPDVSKPAKKPR